MPPELRDANNDSVSTSRTDSRTVAVIGGSAAGLFTASLLAQRGVPVRVFERIGTLEPAARTLIVTHRMRDLLGRAGEKAIVNEIHNFELFTDGRSATIALKHPDLIIERRSLIQGLAEEAIFSHNINVRRGRRLLVVNLYHAEPSEPSASDRPYSTYP